MTTAAWALAAYLLMGALWAAVLDRQIAGKWTVVGLLSIVTMWPLPLLDGLRRSGRTWLFMIGGVLALPFLVLFGLAWLAAWLLSRAKG